MLFTTSNVLDEHILNMIVHAMFQQEYSVSYGAAGKCARVREFSLTTLRKYFHFFLISLHSLPPLTFLPLTHTLHISIMNHSSATHSLSPVVRAASSVFCHVSTLSLSLFFVCRRWDENCTGGGKKRWKDEEQLKVV